MATTRTAGTIRKTAAVQSILISSSKKYFIGFSLQLGGGQFPSAMRLHVHVELVKFLHAGFPGGLRLDRRAEFLEVDANPVEGKTASAMWTLDSVHYLLL